MWAPFSVLTEIGTARDRGAQGGWYQLISVIGEVIHMPVFDRQTLKYSRIRGTKYGVSFITVPPDVVSQVPACNRIIHLTVASSAFLCRWMKVMPVRNLYRHPKAR